MRACYEAPSLAMARAIRQDVVKRFRDRFPAAIACFEDDFEACIAHLRFPIAHRKFIRTTNLLERLFVEVRRRSSGVCFTPFEKCQLETVRAELDQEYEKRTAPAVRSAEAKSPSSISSKVRT